MKINLYFIFLIFLLNFQQGFSQIKIDNNRSDIDYLRLSQIDNAMQSYINKKQLAGLVTLISKEGSIIQLGKYGYTSIDLNLPINETSIFRIASMTKPVVSVAVMILYEKGLLKLTDPIDLYLPAFKNMQCLQSDGSIEQCKQRIKIIHLLSHTSGITYVQDGNVISQLYKARGINDGVIISEIGSKSLEKISEVPLKFEPGTQWEYGLSTDLLGYIVEKISNKKLEEFLKDEILNPLEMNDTYFKLDQEKIKRLVPIHSIKDGRLVELENSKEYTISGLSFQPDYPYNINNKTSSGGGGLVSTILDYHKFLSMILNKGTLNGKKILSVKSVELMQLNHIGDIPFFKKGYRFGLGFAVLTDLAKSVNIGSEGNLSWGGIFYTRFWVDPKEKLIGITMAQQFPFSHLDAFKKFQTLTYQALNDKYNYGLEHIGFDMPTNELKSLKNRLDSEESQANDTDGNKIELYTSKFNLN